MVKENEPISRGDEHPMAVLSPILALHSSLLFSTLDLTDSLKSTEILAFDLHNYPRREELSLHYKDDNRESDRLSDLLQIMVKWR